jgi:hypothetical protein
MTMAERKFYKFPYQISDLDHETNREVSKKFSDGLPSLVQVGEQKMLIPGKFRDEAEKLYNFQVRKSDVFIVGFPRSGTTLTQELVWLLVHNLDFAKAKAKNSLIDRVPLLEARAVTTEKTLALCDSCPGGPDSLKNHISSIESLAQMDTTATRIIKSHLQFSFLPPNLVSTGCKVMYIARNPKDVIVSMYHLQRNSHGREFVGSFEEFFNYFLSDLIFFTPYWTHLREGWERRSRKNFRFLYYEEITRDLRRFIVETADFLGKELTEEEVQKLYETLSFDQFKKYISETDKQLNSKENVNDDFVRKGKVGDYKNYFDDEMNERADKWIDEHLKLTGVEFPFEF